MGSIDIEITKQIERRIICMQRTTFDPVLRFYQDAAKTIPLALAGRTFFFVVNDKAGGEILNMAIGSGLTIQNVNELAFLDQLAIANGTFRYTLLMTNGAVTRPIMQGDFQVLKNQKP